MKLKRITDDKAIEIWEGFDPEKPIPLADMLATVLDAQLEADQKVLDAVVREIFEEFQPHLDVIQNASDAIRGDWTDPRSDVKLIWEALGKIESLKQSTLKKYGGKK